MAVWGGPPLFESIEEMQDYMKKQRYPYAQGDLIRSLDFNTEHVVLFVHRRTFRGYIQPIIDLATGEAEHVSIPSVRIEFIRKLDLEELMLHEHKLVRNIGYKRFKLQQKWWYKMWRKLFG